MRFRDHLPYLGAGVRALYGNERHGGGNCIGAIAALGDGQGAVGGGVLLLHPGDIFFSGAGVDHQAEPALVDEVDDQVVDDEALRVEHAGVQGLARYLQLVDVVGQQAAQEGAHVVALDVDHAHVGYVEHADVGTHRVVFFDLRTIVDRHVPAAEIDHAGACGTVGVIEWGSFERHNSSVQKSRG